MRDTLPISDPDRHPVDVLAEEFAERIRRGERPSVAEYARLYPEHADELRAALPPIVMMERLKERNRSASYSMGLGPAVASPPPERLGDFRIVREIGRGGMGIVYEARQESLGGRPVAVKVLARAARLDDQRLERFEREARAAAALHHANIVPVFGVGQADGVHFIVMQLIDGRPLSEVVRTLAGGGRHPGESLRGGGLTGWTGSGSAADRARASPPPGEPATPPPHPRAVPTGRAYWRWVAEVGRQAAAALDHAHRHGVLHRDVKPGNLIVNDTGEVFVTDFGLAKVGDQATDVTRAGDVIGTLQYLAPEGLRGTTDARGDVYGLGATLYELLTLRPPVEAETPAALMKQLADADPPPPRKVCPQVPADLETVVLKAIARSPDNRYQAAGQLADDLANVLADRPITARR
ncbi:MAG TPA: serine/threonine-protein kinase, partial [Humisphaera sp.]